MAATTFEAPIQDLALIGDTRTAALCDADGVVRWMCVPTFDSAPLFGSLVLGADGGSFAITPLEIVSRARRYLGDSPVLETTWETATGAASLTEGMVAHVGRMLPQVLLVRTLRCAAGLVRARLRFDPRFAGQPRVRRYGRVLVITAGSLAVSLAVDRDLDLDKGLDVVVELRAGESLTASLGVADREPIVMVSAATAARELERTRDWWERWSTSIEYDGPFRDAVVRSLITLRLLTYAPSGAPVAAPTTSLPERVGGSLNWDYRYAWPRDASLGIGAFLRVGMVDEARSFVSWLLHAARLTRPRIEVLYTLLGHQPTDERTVPGSGYRASLPVRVGNAAAEQLQLDVYGWLFFAASELARAGESIKGELARALAAAADLVASTWMLPDAGIWEEREQQEHHVHSKIMCWAALDRAERLLGDRYARRAKRWRRAREEIAREVSRRGFDRERRSYVHAYGDVSLDAALLLAPMFGFEGADSPRITDTINAIRRELGAGGALVRRRPAPAGEDGEGAFLPCSFWLAHALATTGRPLEALQILERSIAYGNDLGLFAEEIDPQTGDHLGNFPQALTHASLVQAALAVDAAMKDRRRPRAERRTPRARAS